MFSPGLLKLLRWWCLWCGRGLVIQPFAESISAFFYSTRGGSNDLSHIMGIRGAKNASCRGARHSGWPDEPAGSARKPALELRSESQSLCRSSAS
jgi:hypothetical protein